MFSKIVCILFLTSEEFAIKWLFIKLKITVLPDFVSK